jgi:hypothetical protein
LYIELPALPADYDQCERIYPLPLPKRDDDVDKTEVPEVKTAPPIKRYFESKMRVREYVRETVSPSSGTTCLCN